MIHTLLSTARSGSTWYGVIMSRRCNGNFLGEVFHNEIAVNTQKRNLISIMKEYAGPERNCVIKVFPNHLMDTSIPNLEETIFSTSQEVEILVRRNFNDQLKSLYVANEYESLKNPMHDVNQPATWQDNFNEPLVIDQIDKFKVEYISKRIAKELLYLSKLYHKHKFKLSYLEDIKNENTQYIVKVGKLHRPVIWNEQIPTVDFDTESLFQ